MQKDQVIADFLRDFVGDDGQRGDDTELRAFEKCRGDQDAVDKIVKGVADQDQQTGAPMIVRRRLRKFLTTARIIGFT